MRAKKNPGLRKAEGWMQAGGTLVEMHTRDGVKPFIVPGGPITEAVFQALLSRPDIQPSGDGLFPGISQTYKMRNGGGAP